MSKKKKTFIQKLWKNIVEVFSSKPQNVIEFKIPDPKCSYCGVIDAKWKHDIVSDYACDDCVPRGCSCNLYEKTKRKTFSIENYEYKKDKKGREIPCEEWIKLH